MAGRKEESMDDDAKESVKRAAGLFAAFVGLCKENKQDLMDTAGQLREQFKANADASGNISPLFLKVFEKLMGEFYPECAEYFYAFMKDRYGESSKRATTMAGMTYADFEKLVAAVPAVFSKLAEPGLDIQDVYKSHGYNLASIAYSSMTGKDAPAAEKRIAGVPARMRIAAPGESPIAKDTNWATSIQLRNKRDKALEVSISDPGARINDITRAGDGTGTLNLLMKDGAAYTLGYEGSRHGSIVLRDSSGKALGEFILERNFFGVPKALVEKVPFPPDLPFALKAASVGGKAIAIVPYEEHIAFRERRKASKV